MTSSDNSVVAQPPAGVLLVTGTIGSGKTTVAIEVGRQLEITGLSSAVIDLDWLTWVYLGEQFHSYDDLAIRNLLSIWPNLRAVGVRYLVLARALLHRKPLDILAHSWPDTPLTVVRLVASSKTLEQRLRQRDIGATLRDHLTEVATMTTALDTVALQNATVINDGHSLESVALQIIAHTAWHA